MEGSRRRGGVIDGTWIEGGSQAGSARTSSLPRARRHEDRAKQVRVPGGIFYGYRVRREFDDSGEPVRGLRSIDI